MLASRSSARGKEESVFGVELLIIFLLVSTVVELGCPTRPAATSGGNVSGRGICGRCVGVEALVIFRFGSTTRLVLGSG